MPGPWLQPGEQEQKIEQVDMLLPERHIARQV
jgi:hypothetical protein